MTSSPLSAVEPLIWPLQTEPGLAASFCEFRARHFHGGVDIKTWGARSRPCLAVDDGVVNRVKVQAAGYGKALYLTLPDGRVAVYAHLDKFASPVAEKVRSIQEASGNFEVDLFWEGDSGVPYKKGDIVAQSGVTGTVHPHLHFEIRAPDQSPINPLCNGLAAADHIAPIPVSLALTPLDGNSTVEGDYQTRLYTRLLKKPDGYYSPGDPIGATGRIGISMDEYDQADGAVNEMAAFRMEMIVSGETYWITEFDKFQFDQTKMIEIERDYRIMRRGKGSYHRLYRMPGNRLRFSSGDGIIDAGLSDSYPIDVTILLSDVAGNSNRIEFQIVSDMVEDTSRGVGGYALSGPNGWGRRTRDAIGVELLDGFLRLDAGPGISSFTISGAQELSIPAIAVPGGVAAGWTPPFDWDGVATISAISKKGTAAFKRQIVLNRAWVERTTVIYTDDSLCAIEIPAGALYDDLWIDLEPEEGFEIADQIESVYSVEPRDQPIFGQVTVKLRRPGGRTLEKGWGVYYYNSRLGWTFMGREQEGSYLTGKASSWERYSLMLDDVAPTIAVGQPKNGVTNNRSPELSFTIKDTLAGISPSGIIVRLDGRKIPAEYDQPRARVYYRPWKPLGTGPHKYEIEVTDRAGNTSRRELSLKIQG